MRTSAEYMRERSRDHLARGLCRKCSRPFKEGYTLCENCLEKIRRNSRRYRNEKIEKGVCLNCGKPKTESTRICSRCKTIKKENALNKCISCGGVRDFIKDGRVLVRCKVCNDRYNKMCELRRTVRRQTGLCWHCGKKKDGERSTCSACFARIKVRLAKREKKEQEKRRELKKQGFHVVSRQRMYQIRHRELGLCILCSEKTLEGKEKCPKHSNRKRSGKGTMHISKT